MPLQSSGAISLNQIHVEAAGSGVSGTQASINDADIRGLISKASGAQMSFSEWYGASSFSWSSPVGGISYSPTAAFNIEEENREGNQARARTRINITWNSNGTHTTSYTDDARNYPGDVVSGAGYQIAGGNIVTSTNTVSILEARFVFVDIDVDFQTATSNELVGITYTPGGSISTTSVTVRNNTQNDATDLDFTDSWRTITPAVMGGNGSNTQTFDVFTQAESTASTGDGCVISTSDNTNDYIGLEIRANGAGGPTMLLRSSTSGVDIDSYSFEVPEFTCIMPDMIVLEESKGYIRIGDIVVGDRIYAKGDLNDPTVESIYAEVTEARTHTRSGYWNVDGLHITNDHPVWLNDSGTGKWVNVEDMRDGITRNYVEGTVDPVYLGTTPGHYYVYTIDLAKKFTVSGSYAPTTE